MSCNYYLGVDTLLLIFTTTCLNSEKYNIGKKRVEFLTSKKSYWEEVLYIYALINNLVIIICAEFNGRPSDKFIVNNLPSNHFFSVPQKYNIII